MNAIYTTSIKVNETVIGNKTYLCAFRKDRKPINIKDFFQPYYDKGLEIKKMFYLTSGGFLTATLTPKKS